MSLRAQGRTEGGETFSAEVTELGETSLFLRLDQPIPRRARLFLEFLGHQVEAEVLYVARQPAGVGVMFRPGEGLRAAISAQMGLSAPRPAPEKPKDPERELDAIAQLLADFNGGAESGVDLPIESEAIEYTPPTPSFAPEPSRSLAGAFYPERSSVAYPAHPNFASAGLWPPTPDALEQEHPSFGAEPSRAGYPGASASFAPPPGGPVTAPAPVAPPRGGAPVRPDGYSPPADGSPLRPGAVSRPPPREGDPRRLGGPPGRGATPFEPEPSRSAAPAGGDQSPFGNEGSWSGLPPGAFGARARRQVAPTPPWGVKTTAGADELRLPESDAEAEPRPRARGLAELGTSSGAEPRGLGVEPRRGEGSMTGDPRLTSLGAAAHPDSFPPEEPSYLRALSRSVRRGGRPMPEVAGDGFQGSEPSWVQQEASAPAWPEYSNPPGPLRTPERPRYADPGGDEPEPSWSESAPPPVPAGSTPPWPMQDPVSFAPGPEFGQSGSSTAPPESLHETPIRIEPSSIARVPASERRRELELPEGSNTASLPPDWRPIETNELAGEARYAVAHTKSLPPDWRAAPIVSEDLPISDPDDVLDFGGAFDPDAPQQSSEPVLRVEPEDRPTPSLIAPAMRTTPAVQPPSVAPHAADDPEPSERYTIEAAAPSPLPDSKPPRAESFEPRISYVPRPPASLPAPPVKRAEPLDLESLADLWPEISDNGVLAPRDEADALAIAFTLLAGRPLIARVAGQPTALALVHGASVVRLRGRVLAGRLLVLSSPDIMSLIALIARHHGPAVGNAPQFEAAVQGAEPDAPRMSVFPAEVTSTSENGPLENEVPRLEGRLVRFDSLAHYRVQYRVNIARAALIVRSPPLPNGSAHRLELAVPDQPSVEVRATVAFEAPGVVGFAIQDFAASKDALESLSRATRTGRHAEAPRAPKGPLFETTLLRTQGLREVIAFADQRARRREELQGWYARILDYEVRRGDKVVLEVVAGHGARLRLWLHQGAAVFALVEGDGADESIGRRLVRDRRITSGALQEAVEHAKSNKIPLGAALLARGDVPKPVLFGALRQQLADRAAVPWEWDGRLRVLPWQDPEISGDLLSIEGESQVTRLLRDQIRAASLEALEQALADKLGRTVLVTPEGLAPRFGYSPKELKLFSRAQSNPVELSGLASATASTPLDALRAVALGLALGTLRFGDETERVVGRASKDERYLRDQLRSRENNHLFGVLGLHWTASGEDVERTAREQLAEFKPYLGSSEPEVKNLAQRLSALVESSRAELGDRTRRVEYRKKTISKSDRENAAEHMVTQAEMLVIRGEPAKALPVLEIALELHRLPKGVYLLERLSRAGASSPSTPAGGDEP